MIFGCKMGHVLKQIFYRPDAFPTTPLALFLFMTVLGVLINLLSLLACGLSMRTFMILFKLVGTLMYGGTKQFILCNKLSKLKGVSKELNIKPFGHISTRANKAKNEFEVAQLQLDNQPMNENFQHMVAKLRKIVVGLCEAERSFYYQKAKCIFLKQSDTCTKFFHSVVKRNSRRNFIAAILKKDGTYTTSQDQIATEFVKFYNTLLGKTVQLGLLTWKLLPTVPWFHWNKVAL